MDEIEELFNPNIASFRDSDANKIKGTWKAHYKIFDMENYDQLNELESIMSSILNGKAMLGYEDKNWDPKGKLRVFLKWMTVDE